MILMCHYASVGHGSERSWLTGDMINLAFVLDAFRDGCYRISRFTNVIPTEWYGCRFYFEMSNMRPKVVIQGHVPLLCLTDVPGCTSMYHHNEGYPSTQHNNEGNVWPSLLTIWRILVPIFTEGTDKISCLGGVCLTLISHSWLRLASAVRSLANQVSGSLFPLAPAHVSLLLDEVQGKYYYWTRPVFFLQQRKITHFFAHPEHLSHHFESFQSQATP